MHGLLRHPQKAMTLEPEYYPYLLNETIMGKVQGTISKSVQFEMDMAQAFALTLLCPPCCVINTMVLVTVIYNQEFHTTDHYVIASLALSDLICGLLYMPMAVIARIPGLEHLVRSHRFTCHFWWCLGMLGMGSSLTNLCLLSGERFVAINWPLQHQRLLTTTRLFGILAGLWTLELVRCFTPMFIAEYHEDETDPSLKCNFRNSIPDWYYDYWTLPLVYLWITAGFIFSTQVSIVTFRHWRQLKKNAQFMTASERVNFHSRLASVRITIAATYFYIFIWTLRCIVRGMHYIHSMTVNQLSIAYTFVTILLEANSLLNPIIFALCRRRFRKAYQFLLTTPPCDWSQLRYVDVPDTAVSPSTKRTMENATTTVNTACVPSHQTEGNEERRSTGYVSEAEEKPKDMKENSFIDV